MGILAADQLEASRYFSSGTPVIRGSSFELSVGTIVDHEGNRSTGPFVLKPGHMVQVVSKEVFKLPPTITGHVTYKTALTRQGIWALTVGIVDPGWEGPIGTTLLNFSSVSKIIHRGDTFLRVTLFEHRPVDALHLPKPVAEPAYVKDIQELAITRFPPTFLDSSEIIDATGKYVVGKMRRDAFAWLAAAAAVFTIIQLIVSIVPPIVEARLARQAGEREAIESLSAEIKHLNDRLEGLENSR